MDFHQGLSEARRAELFFTINLVIDPLRGRPIGAAALITPI
jgi:hypothetical protein